LKNSKRKEESKDIALFYQIFIRTLRFERATSIHSNKGLVLFGEQPAVKMSLSITHHLMNSVYWVSIGEPVTSA